MAGKGWKVVWRPRRTEKNVRRLPLSEQKRLAALVDDLREKGPYRSEWSNYGKLGPDTLHCHLSYSWVVCWKVDRKAREIEIYYAGSREEAPY